MTDAKLYGDAHTVSDTFIMKQSRALRNPIVFDSSKDEKKNAKIRGKLYGVNVEHIHNLDIAKGNWTEHFRTERWVYSEVSIPNTRVINGFSAVKAFMYIGIPEFWENERLVEKTKVSYSWWKDTNGSMFYHHTNFLDKKESIFNDDYSEYCRWTGWGHVG